MSDLHDDPISVFNPLVFMNTFVILHFELPFFSFSFSNRWQCSNCNWHVLVLLWISMGWMLFPLIGSLMIVKLTRMAPIPFVFLHFHEELGGPLSSVTEAFIF